MAVGATVAPGGEALLELGDPTRLQVVAQAAESDLNRVAVDQQAEVELPALATRIAAKVESFSPRVDPESRRAQVYLALAKQADGLRAGMLAQVALRAGGETAIRAAGDGGRSSRTASAAWCTSRSADGSFEAREVKTGRNRTAGSIVLEGLAPGDRVVMRGALLLDTQAEQLL